MFRSPGNDWVCWQPEARATGASVLAAQQAAGGRWRPMVAMVVSPLGPRIGVEALGVDADRLATDADLSAACRHALAR